MPDGDATDRLTDLVATFQKATLSGEPAEAAKQISEMLRIISEAIRSAGPELERS